jgi:putative membrane protein
MSEAERGPGTRGTAAEEPPAAPAAEPTRAREHLANERTLLAWTRTSLTLIGVGFVVARFGLFLRALEAPGQPVARFGLSALIGIAAVVAGLVAGGIALVRFGRARRQIEAGSYRAEYWPEALLMAMVGVLGVALAVYLAVNG